VRYHWPILRRDGEFGDFIGQVSIITLEFIALLKKGDGAI
jgi:hypothetical protein